MRGLHVLWIFLLTTALFAGLLLGLPLSYLVAAVGGGGLLYVNVFHYQVGLYLVVISLAFQRFFVIEAPGLFLSVTDAMLVLFLAVAGIRFLIRPARVKRLDWSYVAVLVLFLLIALNAVFISSDLRNSFPYYLRFLVAASFWFFVALEASNDLAQARKLLIFFGISGMIMAITVVGEMKNLASGGFYRILGGADNPNMLADFIGVSSIVFLYLFLETKSLYLKALFMAVWGYMFLIVVLTFSRWGWVSFALATSLWVGFNFDLKKQLFAASGLLLAFLVKRETLVAVLTKRDVVDLSTISRFATYRTGLRAIQQYPLFGVGFDQFSALYQYTWVPTLAYKRTAHNIYLKVGAETGVFGLLSFLYLLVAPAVKLLIHASRGVDARERLLVLTISFMLVHQIMSEVSKSALSYPVLWFVMGLAAGTSSRLSTRRPG